jgi:hypothetical protein
MGPYAGADYNFTLSHGQLRSSAFHPNDGADEFSLIIQKGNNLYGKGEYDVGGMEGEGFDFIS